MDVAIAGLGRMGRALARRLLDQGHRVAVWNRSPGPARALGDAGAEVVGDLAGAWAGGRPVVTLLADDAAVEAVCGELVAAAPAGALLVEMSTISAAASERVAARAEAAGVRYLRAPVSGNPSAVTAGDLGIIVSGDRAAFDDALPLLAAIGPKVFHVGDGEQARIMKLALNAIIAGTTQLLAEAITLGEAHGLRRTDMLEVMAGSAVASPFIGYKTAALVGRDYTPTFTTALLAKDLALAVDAAGDDLPLPVTELVRRLVDEAVDEGLGELDLLALLPHLQHRAGRPTDVPVPARGRAGAGVPRAARRRPPGGCRARG
ncbi:MAG: NAD(P)-dependent oxidoreductase [Solirubrobacteraceae bacterium]|nr:NAD(P)-dependent oxidoreductase [Solirubrobacteraceae bacterium]